MSFSIKVDKQSIPTLIRDITETNNYLLPSFQRRFVWDEDDVLALLDSIKNGYPIGNIILWKKPEDIKPEEIDPLSKPLIGDVKKNASSTYFVIDGQQRLTALLLIFNNWKIRRGKETIEINPIGYDYGSDKFYKGTRRGMDVSVIVRGIVYNERDAMRELSNLTDEAYNKIKELATALQEYEIPIYEIKTPGADEKVIDMLVEAFIRVNKLGVRIKSLELILSYIAGRVSGKAKKHIMTLYDLAEESFDLDLQPIIRYSLAVANIKQTQATEPNKLRSLIRKYVPQITKTLVDNFDRVRSGLEVALKLLKEELKISSADILPSQIPLVPIAVYFYTQQIDSLSTLSNTEKKNIENWFVLVNFTTYYTSKTNSKLENDIASARNSSTFPYNELIDNIKKYNGRTYISSNDIMKGLEIDVTRKVGKPHLFLLYMLLVKNDADDWTGYKIYRRKWQDLSKHHIFPRDYLKDHRDELEFEEAEEFNTLANNLGNITLINKSKNSKIGESPPRTYLEEIKQSILEKHMIPLDESLWDITAYYDFIRRRIELIIQKTEEHYSSLFRK